MKILFAALCVATLCSAAAGAQSSKQTTSKKITIKEGRDITVVGCVERAANETGFELTRVADKHGAWHSYTLVPDDAEHLVKHVGHLVEIKGKATDRGDAKVKIETRTKREADHDDAETHGETQLKGDLPNVRYLGVSSLKLIARACP